MEILTTNSDSIGVVYCHATINDTGAPKALPVSRAEREITKARRESVDQGGDKKTIQSRGRQHVAEGNGVALTRR